MNDAAQTATQRGMALLDLGRAREAEEHLRTALAGNPGDPLTLALLADAQLRQQRYEEAMLTSRSALAADPSFVPAYSVLTGALAGLERYEEATDTAERGLALAPEVPALHLQLAGVLAGRKHLDDALVSVDRARALDPESAVAAAMRAGILHDLRRYDEAAEAVAEALRIDPENPYAHRISGVLALRRGGSGDAVRAHRTALRLDPTDEGSRDGLALALKTRNPLYNWLVRASLWLDSLPRLVRIAVLLMPLVLTRVLRPFDDQLWAKLVIIVVAAVVLLTWTLEPLMNAVLLLGKDRHLVPRAARQATALFAAFLAAAVACAVVSQVNGPAQLLPVALGFGLWAMATGSAHALRPGRRKLVVFGAAAPVVLGAIAIVAVLAASPGATVAVALVLLSGVAALWFTAFAG